MAQITNKEKQLALIKKACHDSIQTFGKACTSVATLPYADFHWEILATIRNPRSSNIVIAAPRWHAKSTIVNTIYVLWAAVTGRKKFIVLVSNSEWEAKKQLAKIKYEIESNDMLRMLFWDLKSDKWSELNIELSNWCEIVAKGASSQIRGMQSKYWRPDLIVLDDIENDEMAKNSDTVTRMEDDFLQKWVLPALAKKGQNISWSIGQVIYVWTIIKEDCLIDRVMKYKKWWVQLKYSAIKEDNTPLFPDLYRVWPSEDPEDTREDLLEIRQRLIDNGKLHVWLSEYMNEYADKEDWEFAYEWFKDQTVELSEAYDKKLKYYIAVDLAISQKETADYTVVLVAWVDSRNNIYVVDMARGRFDPWETIDKIFELWTKWNVKRVGIESIWYQRGLIHFVNDEMRKRNKFLNVVELKTPRSSKEERIRSALQARYRSKSIFHVKDVCWDLEAELLSFPRGKHDDIVDALAYIPFMITPYSSKNRNEESRNNNWNKRTKNFITWY